MQASSARVPRAARAWRYTASSGLPHPNSPSIHHHVEVAREVVLLDLPPLLAPVAIGHEGERDRRGSAGERARRGTPGNSPHPPPPVVGKARRPGRPPAGPPARAESGEGVLGDLRPRPHHVQALALMAARIIPEPAPGARDGLAQGGGIEDRRAWPRCHRPGTRNRPRPPSSRAACRPDRRAKPSRVGGLLPRRIGGGRGKWRQLRAAHRAEVAPVADADGLRLLEVGLAGDVLLGDRRDTPSSSAPTAG